MTKRDTSPQNPTFECIASRERREILSALLTWGAVLTEEQLAAYLAATTQGTPPPDSTATETVQAELTHVHLPALEAAGLVTWKREDGTVRTTNRLAFEDPRFERLLELQTDGLDGVLSALAHEYRRIVLTVLEGEEPSMSRAELAREILRRAPEATDPDPATVEEVTTSLHHVHLPTLDDMDLLEYDSATGHATYTGHPALEEVITIIYETDRSAVEKLGGFLEGLSDSYGRASRGTSDQLEWPHFWREPHHG